MKNRKGFTLIELLAVIIILGILMIIAIPSVTKYISDSRKNAYVDTAKEIVGGARNLVNEGKLEMYDTDTTYYIESGCIKTENASKSPYGEFTKAYVVVTYDGNGYTYYWTSNDDAGQGIKNIVRIDKLDTDNVESDLKDSEISTLRGIDGRSETVVISEANNCQKEGSNEVEMLINGETGDEINPVIYPEGKNKSSVIVGDIVKIGDEEFYVIKELTNGRLTLLSHYNLNVGNNKKPDATEGIQNSSVVGYKEGYENYGGVNFSTSNYWVNSEQELIYPGVYCVYVSDTNCVYVYDENSLIYPYLQNYKKYLKSLGTIVKEVRLITYEEVRSLEENWDMSKVHETQYWTGSAVEYRDVFQLYANTTGTIASHGYYLSNSGVRPVIVI